MAAAVITEQEIEIMEATFQHGLQLCLRLRKKLEGPARSSSSRKGSRLTPEDHARVVLQAQRFMNKKRNPPAVTDGSKKN